jgi:ABC-type multidrug transport system fused ATPase/permease subunit
MAADKKQKHRTAYGYMLGGLRRHPGAIVFALILTLISSLLLTLPTVLVQLAVDEVVIAQAITEPFMFYIWLIVSFTLIYMVMYFVVGYVWAVVTLRWERDARQEFFEILQKNSMTFHDEVDSKKLLSVAMQDINWVRLSLNPAVRNIVGAFASIGITAVLLMAIDLTPGLFGLVTVAGIPVPVFTLLILGGIPIYLVFAYRYANAVEPFRRSLAEEMEQITSLSQGVFQGIEVVRAFGTEDKEIDKFDNASKRYARYTVKEGRLAAFYIPALVLTFMTTLAVYYGGYAVLNGVMTVGTLSQVLLLLIGMIGFNFMLPRMLLMMRGGYVNAQRIVDILNWEDVLIEPDYSAQVDWTKDIVFENVSFQYGSNNGNGNHYALKDFNITIPGGSRVALIGGPGGGKSTILKLLLRLYDPAEGSIKVGGVDLRKIRTEDVRDAVALVEQDIFLFRMTVGENISFGRKDATMEEIVDAAKRAQAEEFIVQLDEGYDSMVGERGMTLSGGQRQRLAIARAIIQDPKVLLLDDSVSAVDAQTEFLMRKALEEVMVGRTSITVTQRLRTLLESDLVIMVDKGKLIAAGCHEDLLQSCDQYRHIFERLPGAQALLEGASSVGGAA